MNERLSKIIGHPATAPVVSGLVGVGVGFAIGYILGKRRQEVEYYDIPNAQMELDFIGADRAKEVLDEIIANERLTVVEIREDERETTPEEVGAEFVERLIQEVPQPELEEGVIASNVFAGTDDEWDIDAELAKRDSTQPYILHKDEFYADELGLNQMTLTYYDGDAILCDEDSKPIYNHANIVGELQFGHGSGDPNVVYIRNLRLKAEYEILKDSGFYQVEVLGYEIENEQAVRDLRHSSHPRKLRQDN